MAGAGESFDTSQVPRLKQIRLAHSVDRGRSVASRADVADPASGTSFMQPSLARDASGQLLLGYYAASAGADANASYRIARSNGTDTFGPTAIVQQPVLFSTSRTSLRWVGDYERITTHDGVVYGAYTDNSGSASHVAVCRAQ